MRHLTSVAAVFLAAFASIVVAADPAPPISPVSPFGLALTVRPVPTDVDELLHVRDLLRMTGDVQRAARVEAIAERAVVHAMLGRPAEAVPKRVADIPAAAPYSDLEFDKLRTEALARAIADVPNPKNKTPQYRTFRNASEVPVTGFLVLVASPPGTPDHQCRYEGLLRQRDTVDRVCAGYSGPRLATPLVVRWVRVEPGGYEIKEGKGVFADTAAKTQARLASVPPEQLIPEKGSTATADMERRILQGFAQITLWLAGPGFVIGLLAGVLGKRRGGLIVGIGVASAVLAGVAAMVHLPGLGGGGIRDNMGLGGIILIVSALKAFGIAIAAAVAWMLFNVGVWIGMLVGHVFRRLSRVTTTN